MQQQQQQQQENAKVNCSFICTRTYKYRERRKRRREVGSGRRGFLPPQRRGERLTLTLVKRKGSKEREEKGNREKIERDKDV